MTISSFVALINSKPAHELPTNLSPQRPSNLLECLEHGDWRENDVIQAVSPEYNLDDSVAGYTITFIDGSTLFVNREG